MIYKEVVTLKYLEHYAKTCGHNLVCYAINTCWWCLLKDNSYKNEGFPCDPRGSMLMQASIGKFIENAKSNPEHYGKHGLKTFMAAYEGNVLTDDGQPTSLTDWRAYNNLIDGHQCLDPRVYAVSELDQTCPMCKGCGEIANDDDMTPWIDCIGQEQLVFRTPIECPNCSGDGTIDRIYL